MSKVIVQLRKELKANIDLKYKAGSENFFTEPIRCYGVRTPIVRKLLAKYFRDVKDLDKKEVFRLCEELLRSGYNEEVTIATGWLRKIPERITASDFVTFERWINQYLDNWAKIDDFCTHVMHSLIEREPQLIPRVKSWTKSKNIWLRRASAVSFITYGKSGYTKKVLKDVFEVADSLLEDKDDLVQKGYGWMLKVAADGDQKAVFDYVMKHKDRMPRTALRYAIEKMPVNIKKQAMSK